MACANILRKQTNYSRHVFNFLEKLQYVIDNPSKPAPMKGKPGMQWQQPPPPPPPPHMMGAFPIQKYGPEVSMHSNMVNKPN